jgi:transposase
MWDGYVNLAGPNGVFRNAVNVIDLFHFMQHMGKALDGERKLARKEFPDSEVVKNLRWALLKSAEERSTEEDKKLEEAFAVCPKLGIVHGLREELRNIFKKDLTKEEGLAEINKWVGKAENVGSKPLDRFLVTVGNWKEKVANYFTERVTNAGMEGTNNHIRSIIRRSFGYRDFDTLRRRVLLECGN